MVRAVGKARAIELMATGETFGFERARELGLVNHVWEAESGEAFVAKVHELAARFVAPNAASRAIGLIKRACQTGADLDLGSGLALERELQQRLFTGDDAREGLAVYLEKRTAQFTAT